EAKVHTAWLKPDSTYEEGYLAFIDAILKRRPQSAFLNEFLPFWQRIAEYGILNSLAQTLVKITAPGVPDFYQGSELWDLSLVDPDNRRPVDYATRRRALEEFAEAADEKCPQLLRTLWARRRDGRIKLFLIQRALQARHAVPDLFSEGEYLPLDAEGPQSDHLFAFARRRGNAWALVAVPRFPATLASAGKLPVGVSVWGETRLRLPSAAVGGSRWRNAFTGAFLPAEAQFFAADLFVGFPAALLLRAEISGTTEESG
ncbi:MAG TPA: malto-oligosyltrehalose synthase, partial [Desulfuromonadales bacterium]|nr:malto-oligosyltrehalose synthase [Desulfuromonadales bacterium]